jgi:hypothetical protein
LLGIAEACPLFVSWRVNAGLHHQFTTPPPFLQGRLFDNQLCANSEKIIAIKTAWL